MTAPGSPGTTRTSTSPSRPGASIAIGYAASDYGLDQPVVVGRHSGTTGFLRGLVLHGTSDRLYGYARTREDFADFERRVAQWSTPARPRATEWLPFEQTARLAEPGCLFNTDPRISPLAWHRRAFGNRAYSLCGVTHTLVEADLMARIAELLTAPVQSWDALVCASPAGKSVVERCLADWGEYLRERLGATIVDCPVQLPIIPYGIDADALAPTPERRDRGQALRAALGIQPDDIAVLYAGRLSYLDKAHPLPLLAGASEAARRTGRAVHVLLAGQFQHPLLRAHFEEAIGRFGGQARVHLVDGRDAERFSAVWQAADIFCSLSDNVQEVFGLTPLEGMAAGLPVVVTDWDGYRMTVVDGETGMCVPTRLPPAGAGEALALRYDLGIDRYHYFAGYTSLCTVVHIPAVVDAFVRLIEQPELRRRMGEAGLARVRSHFDWRVVILQFEALWAELAERRRKDAERVPHRPGAPVNPLLDDPFRRYADFATGALSPDDRVALAPGMTPERIGSITSADMNRYGRQILADEAECGRLLSQLARHGSQRVGDVVGAAGEEHRDRMWRTVAWLAKLGILAVTPAAAK